MFSTNLAFQQRDLALAISFHSEIVTKGSPPKCFQAYGVIFFFLRALEQEAIMIRSAVDCQKDGRRNTCHQYQAMHFGNDTRWRT